MKIRTDFVTNSSSSSYCVSLIVETVENNKLELDYWPEGEDGSCDVLVPLNEDIDAVVDQIKSCSSVEELNELLLNALDLEELYENYGEAEADVEFSESMEQIKDISDIKSVSINEYFTGWGEFARDGITDFLEKAVTKGVDIEDANAVRADFEEKLTESEIESIVEQIEYDCIGQFNANIVTTVYISDGNVEKKYTFEA